MQIGIQPDILVCRTERPLSEDLKRKIAQFCNVDFGCVVESPDVKSIYEIPLKLHAQGLDKEVCMRLHLDTKEPDLRAWAAMVDKILKPPHQVRIAVVGKYTELADSYKSIHEALVHGGIANEVGVAMRLGAYPCRLRPGSHVAQAYNATEVSERHRHRYEVSNAYRDVLAEYGMRCSGLSPDGSLVEMIELPDHPWFIGCQFHPELKSRPTRPHPLFAGFVGASRQLRRARGGTRAPVAERRAELARRHD